VSQRPSAKKKTATKKPARATRRPRGQPRRLLLEAASDLFARQDYRSTTTREIAEAAGVTEALLFRHFGSKAALFRETMVVPFTSFVDDFRRTWRAVVPEQTDEDELARHFVGQLYEVFVDHRGLIVTLLASEALSDEEMAEAGIADIRSSLAVLGQISSEGMAIRGMHSSQPDLAAYSTVAMIAGMVALRSTYFGTDQPSREAIVEELTQAILHGFLHRNG
jgi:AcrR family transcriptional regulator